jgi:hypothetical protein
MIWYGMIWYHLMIWYEDMLYFLTEIRLTPGAVVKYTFTHKQYAEQHNETECLERNVHKNKET